MQSRFLEEFSNLIGECEIHTKHSVKIKCGYYLCQKINRMTKNILTNCFKNSTYDSLRKIENRTHNFFKLEYLRNLRE